MLSNLKTEIAYTGTIDPKVRWIAISLKSKHPYIWAKYYSQKRSELPNLSSDFIILPIDGARKLFKFVHVPSLSSIS